VSDWGRAEHLEDIPGAVAIAGIGETAYTKASGRTAREIGAEAAERAIADAGLEPEDIDGITWSGAFADFTVDDFRDCFGTKHDMWTSSWGGGMAWAATAPYLAAQAIARGEAHHVINVFPVAWATQRGPYWRSLDWKPLRLLLIAIMCHQPTEAGCSSGLLE
jgi:hypothetical protein